MKPMTAESRVEIVENEDGVKVPNLDAVIRETERIGAVVPQNIDEAYRMAQAVVKAGVAPSSYDNDAQKVMVGILKSMEVGLPPITGLGVIAIINNRPSIWGKGAVALIQSKGVLYDMTIEEIGSVPSETISADKFTETHTFQDDYGIEVKMWRKGQESPYVGRFTVGDAKRAKLWMNPKKSPWMLFPKRMLKWRAFAAPADDGFADCLSGLQIREVVEDLPVAPSTVNTSFLDDAPQDEAPPHSDKPEAPVPDTGESAAAPESAAEPGQGDLLGGPEDSPGKRLREIVNDVMGAASEREILELAKAGADLPDEQRLELDEAVEASVAHLKETAEAQP